MHKVGVIYLQVCSLFALKRLRRWNTKTRVKGWKTYKKQRSTICR